MKGFRLEGAADIRELRVLGEWAYLRNFIEITVTPPGGAAVRRSGYMLTILRKIDGRWRLTRDANLVGRRPRHSTGMRALPAAFRKAAFVRSCQPGPSSEKVEDVLVDAQRHRVLHMRQRQRLPLPQLRWLGRRGLERLLGGGAGIGCGTARHETCL